MRGNEIDISFTQMKKWTPLSKRSEAMQIKACENGEIALGSELRRNMFERLLDEWKVDFYATDDMRILVLHPDSESDFKYPKNGRRKFKNYIESLKEKGYGIPAIYNVEWNEKMESWVGILQEVPECPKVIKRRGKNEK